MVTDLALLAVHQEQPQAERDENDGKRYPDVSRIEFDDVEDPEQQPYTDHDENQAATDSEGLVVFLHSKTELGVVEARRAVRTVGEASI